MAGLRALFQAMTKGLKKIPEDIGTLPSEEELIEKGFDPSTFYHGSPTKNIMEFIPHSKNRNPYIERQGGEPVTFFTENPVYTEEFTGKSLGHEGRIYPVKLKLENVFDYKNPDHVEKVTEKLGVAGKRMPMGSSDNINFDIKIGDPFAMQIQTVSKAIKDSGFNGYLTNETDRFGQRTVGLFEPGKGNVRSIFAKFDPTKSESGNIYASVGGGAFLGYGALEELINDK